MIHNIMISFNVHLIFTISQYYHYYLPTILTIHLNRSYNTTLNTSELSIGMLDHVGIIFFSAPSPKRPMVDPRDLRRCPWLHGVWQRAPPASRSSEAATWLRVRAELWTASGGKHLEKTSWKKKCVRYASGILCFRIPQFDITQELRETTEA